MTPRRRSVVLLLLPLAALAAGGAGCSSGAPSSTSHSSSSTRPRATTATTRPAPATSTSTTTSTTAVPSTTSTAPGPENLLVSATDKVLLTAAFVDYTHLPAPEIAGTAPGTVYFAYDPSTDTYWALASFSPTPSAGQRTQVALQDGGNMGIFSREADSAWHMLSTGFVPFCVSQTAIPPGVIAVWGLRDAGACSTSTSLG